MVSYSLGRARRPLALEMPSSSRYLATVRREMVTPSPSSSWHSFWSDRGRALSYPSTSSLSRLLIWWAEVPSPAEPTSREKKKLRG